MIVLDTHTWIWWLTQPSLLPKKAKNVIHEAMKNYQIAISSMSVWEIAMLCAKGRLEFAIPYREFIRQTEALAFVQFITPDNNIFLNSVEMVDYPVKDPADRIIMATANHLSAILITRDEAMHTYRQVRTLWG
ncbi:MAG: Ribonuclease VapC22 [Turneriella sp.]|nr:Ribonuclease VapC22 [Turneriella sp.]